MLDQSPLARLSKAPSDPPSEFSSWHDDASSSLATLGTGDRTITVNMQRMRMGEHLKGKLQGMIRQRFENYLHIIQTLQNDTGKLAVLECELLMPSRADDEAPVRISISCNEDETFLAYLVPDVSSVLGLGSQAPSAAASCGGSDSQGESSDFVAEHPADAAEEAAAEAAAAAFEGDGGAEASVVDGVGGATGVAPAADNRELLRRWVAQVCEFGMSGRCHSLTALFHFGYTAWKQLLGDARAALVAASGAGTCAPEGGCSSGGGSGSGARLWGAGGMLREEEERRDDDEPHELSASLAPAASALGLPPAGSAGPGAAAAAAPASTAAPASAASAAEEDGGAAVASAEAACAQKARPEAATEARPLSRALLAAQRAMDCERHYQALELCNDGIALAQSAVASGPAAGAAASSSSCSRRVGGASSSSSRLPPPPPVVGLDFSADDGDIDAASARWQLLLLRASVQAQLSSFRAALSDAEELISLQPTCAEGYYWQSMALQGLGRGQESLEALMSALEYDPQNSLFQQAFTSLFEEISASSEGQQCAPGARQPPGARGGSASSAGGGAAAALPRRPPRTAGWPRGPRDALSTTTQATHLSSRSTTPTEVSEPMSRSSSNDSLSIAGAAFEDNPP